MIEILLFLMKTFKETLNIILHIPKYYQNTTATDNFNYPSGFILIDIEMEEKKNSTLQKVI